MIKKDSPNIGHNKKSFLKNPVRAYRYNIL